MQKPDIEAYLEEQGKAQEKWFEEKVKPYLVNLLNQAQAKLSKKLSWSCGMGASGFELGENDHSGNFDYDMNDIAKMRGMFPELVEFMEIAEEIDDKFSFPMGKLSSTENPIKLNYAGNQTSPIKNGKPLFETDSDMHDAIDNADSIEIEEFNERINWDSLKAVPLLWDGSWEFGSYNEIVWAYDPSTDLHHFFA